MHAGCRVIQPVNGITASSRINKADRLLFWRIRSGRFNDGQETVNTTELYANVIDRTIAEHGALWFDEVEYECCARGVFKIDLMDFNQMALRNW